MAFLAPMQARSHAASSIRPSRSRRSAGDRSPAAPASEQPSAIGNQAMLRMSQANRHPAAIGSATARAEAPPVVQQALHSPGQPLEATTSRRFARHFGRGFGAVRVHTDTIAVESARAMDAQAYTVGSEIVFAAGQYQPDTAAGQRLLAHELAHVAQQAGSRSAGRLAIGASGDPHERAADAAAAALARGEPAPAMGRAEPAVQRQQPAAPQPQQQPAAQPQAQPPTVAQIYAEALPIVQTLDAEVYAALSKVTLGGGSVLLKTGKILPATPGGPEGEVTLNLSVETGTIADPKTDAQFDNRLASTKSSLLPNGGPKRDFYPAIVINSSTPTGHSARELAETLVHEGTHMWIYFDSLGLTRSRHVDKFKRYSDMADKQPGKNIKQKFVFFIDLVLTKAGKPSNPADNDKDAAKAVSLLIEEKYVYDQDALSTKKLRSNGQIAADYVSIALNAIGIPPSSQPAADVAKLIGDATGFLDMMDQMVHALPPAQFEPEILPAPLPVLPSR
jgi:Domain of unknown function (DUF4157)